ncbi:MAG: 2-oxo acid dehydrogenase subunit E2 [Bacilli bacterium]|nr:2-oxo acid dehydrogenase subunit E2 [Bacilli bacterium]
MTKHNAFWKEFWRTVKYFLIAASAGLIQFGVCSLFDEVFYAKFNHQYYMVFYFVALVLSVLWNFTINRSVTFKSVGNVPKAMLKVLAYYCVYTPLSLLFAHYGQIWGIPEMVITVINILVNGVTEYLFMRLFVFKKEIDTRNEETKKPLTASFVLWVAWIIALLLLGVNAVVLAHSQTTWIVLWVFIGLAGFTLILGIICLIHRHKIKKQGREPGDRKDAKLIRDIDGIHIAMAQLYGSRCVNEAYISEQIDLAPIKAWMVKHPDEEFKYTFFHVILAALLKLLVVRPKLNRFISNRHYYQKNERSLGFIVKRQFADDAEEGMAVIRGDEKTTIFDVHQAVKNQVIPCKQGKKSSADNALDIFKKLPHWLTCIVFNTIMRWSKKGKLPDDLMEGDSNHCSAFVTNLGSIGLKCGYHHLAEYGTNSIFVVIGQKKMQPFYDEKGNCTMKEVLDIGLTIDERIADGYYYAKSMKIFRKVLENPELLELPFETEVDL